MIIIDEEPEYAATGLIPATHHAPWPTVPNSCHQHTIKLLCGQHLAEGDSGDGVPVFQKSEDRGFIS